MRRYLEDFVPGQTAEFGSLLVDADEIRDFARRYDPQPFHLDAQAAARTPFGGLIASGFHTASMVMRMMVDHYIDGESSLGSPGLGPIRWLLPVRPGDVLRVRARIVDVRPSASKPDRGAITYEIEALNARDEVVMRVENWVGIVRRRPEGAAHAG